LGILPDEHAQVLEDWPWPVKIYTLGRFSLVIEDVAVAFARKALKKPIALLKFIVAAGDRPAPITRALDALWPDEGDAAQKSFKITLHRLRKLLQHAARTQAISPRPRITWWSDRTGIDRGGPSSESGDATHGGAALYTRSSEGRRQYAPVNEGTRGVISVCDPRLSPHRRGFPAVVRIVENARVDGDGAFRIYTRCWRCSWQAKPRAGGMKSPPYTGDYRRRRVTFA